MQDYSQSTAIWSIREGITEALSKSGQVYKYSQNNKNKRSWLAKKRSWFRSWVGIERWREWSYGPDAGKGDVGTDHDLFHELMSKQQSSTMTSSFTSSQSQDQCASDAVLSARADSQLNTTKKTKHKSATRPKCRYRSNATKKCRYEIRASDETRM